MPERRRRRPDAPARRAPGRLPGLAGLLGPRRRPDHGLDRRRSTTSGASSSRCACPRPGRSTTSTSRSWPTGATRCRPSCASGRATRPATCTSPASSPAGRRAPCRRSPSPSRAVESDDFRLTVLAVDRATTTDWYSGGPAVLPVAIAEMGLPGVVRDAPADEVGDRCYDDLLTVDGEPVPIRFAGSTADAEARLPLDVEACDGPVAAAGPTDVVAAEGRDTGLRPRCADALLRPRRRRGAGRGHRHGAHPARDRRRDPAAAAVRRHRRHRRGLLAGRGPELRPRVGRLGRRGRDPRPRDRLRLRQRLVRRAERRRAGRRSR